MDSYEALKKIALIIKETEKDVKEIMNEGTLEKPIKSDIILSKRNMGYNEIKAVIKNYKNENKKVK